MAQRQRLHLTRGSNRSWVSTATVRHASGASVFCQRIEAHRCQRARHVHWMSELAPKGIQHEFRVSRHVC